MLGHSVSITGAAKPDSSKRSGHVGRFLDRQFGRPLLSVIGVLRRTRIMPQTPAHIAICVLGAIGDTILAGALVNDVRRVFPTARITLVASATNHAIAPLLPQIESVIVVPVDRIDVAIRMIRAAQFDIYIDCNQWIRFSALQAALAGCYTIGFRTAGQGRHFAFDRAVDHLATRHELANYRQLLAPLGIQAQSVPAIAIPPNARISVARWVAEANPCGFSGRFVVFHPWAGGKNAGLKEWAEDRWVALAAALSKQGYALYVTGARGDEMKTCAMVKAAEALSIQVVSLAGRLTLPEVAALLAEAAAVVSVNTGIMHLAAAVGARLVALHGPTNPKRWGPISNRAAVVVPKGVPYGYLHLGFEFPKYPVDCMSAISVDAVLEALNIVLQHDQLRPTVETDSQGIQSVGSVRALVEERPRAKNFNFP